MSTMTIGRRIGLGFFVVLVLLAVSGVLSYTGVTNIVGSAGEVISGNKLDALMAQKEIDHLNWGNKLADFLVNPEAKELKIQTDPTKCSFGTWYYGPERKKAEALVPSLVPILAQIEKPHAAVHQSAVRIKEIFRRPHGNLALQMSRIMEAHNAWTQKVCQAIAQNALQETDPAKLKNFKIGVKTDPTKCKLGQWLAAPETKKVLASFPELKSAIDVALEPHRRFHEAGKTIEGLIRQGKFDQALDVFKTEVMGNIDIVRNSLDKAVRIEDQNRDASEKAMAIFHSDTARDLSATLGLISRVRAEVRRNIMTDQGMLDVAKRVQLIVSVVGGGAVLIGIILAIFLIRSITAVLKTMAAQLGDGAGQVESASGQVASSSQQLADGSYRQAASLEQTSAALEEMSAQTRANADNSAQADSLMGEAKAIVGKAGQSMGLMAESMSQISEAGAEISKIVRSIDEIAFQTNLLALNAAVEAARAGEAGAGFAVVADEVRALAMRAAEAAKNTQGLIEDTVKRINQGSDLVSQTQKEFEEITHSAGQVGTLVSEIAAASKEQAQGIDQVNEAIGEVDKIVQANASTSEETAAAAEQLSSQAVTTRALVDRMQALVGAAGTAASGKSPAGDQDGPRRLAAPKGKADRSKKKPAAKVGREVTPEEAIPFDDDDLSEF